MINAKTIEEFLNRPVEEWEWLKSYGHADLDQALNELDPPISAVHLRLHQKVGLLIALELKRFMFHMDPGAGKTLLTLELIRYRKLCGEQPRAIVFVPYISAVDTWVEEVKKHAPDLRCIPLVGSSDANRSRLDQSGDLFVACYQSAVAMVCEKGNATVGGKAQKAHGRNKWQLNAKQVRELFSSFDMLILDEVHKCKTVSSLTYRMCRAISSQCTWAFGLTGTPSGKDLSDLWPQFYLVDFGETLGPTLGFYRAAFFKSNINYWGGLDFVFNPRLMPVLKRIIKHRSIHYGVDEFSDMPEKEYIQRTLTLPAGNAGYAEVSMKAIREALKNGNGNYQEVESNYLKLRQLSSGFLTLKGEDNDRIQISFENNPKLETLLDTLDGIPSDRKCVVWHHFVYSNHLLSSGIAGRFPGLPVARIWGGQKDPSRELKRFREDPNCRFLVINIKSGSSSLNLQFANYLIFFEQPDSPIDRAQAEARVWRPGQKHRVMIYDFLMKGTVDHQLYKSNKEGANLLQELMRGKSEL